MHTNIFIILPHWHAYIHAYSYYSIQHSNNISLSYACMLKVSNGLKHVQLACFNISFIIMLSNNHSINNHYSSRVKDLEEVGKVVSRKLTSGKRNLMLISRDCVLEDTIYYMSKDGFNPTCGITVIILIINH